MSRAAQRHSCGEGRDSKHKLNIVPEDVPETEKLMGLGTEPWLKRRCPLMQPHGFLQWAVEGGKGLQKERWQSWMLLSELRGSEGWVCSGVLGGGPSCQRRWPPGFIPVLAA